MTTYLVRITQAVVLIVIIAVTIIYWLLNQSLPQLTGSIVAPITNKLTVTRDGNGVAQISGQSRNDVSYALGYLHGQERFFQMDLLRRNSAGELSELFGELALSHDQNIRVHQFRKRVNEYVNYLTDEQKQVLQQYTLGVNDGLTQLAATPFEYSLLRVEPQVWQPQDSLLVLYSMYMDLQYEYSDREATLGTLADLLPQDVFTFLTPEGSNWDAAIDHSQYSASPIPLSTWPKPNQSNTATVAAQFNLSPDPQEGFKGSNNWAVSGEASNTGAAIVADDMHLGIAVPNIWYRASLRYQARGNSVSLDGVSLPGTPAIVVGSNHHIAWGFTNSYGDWNDLITLKLNQDKSQYLTPEGFKPFVLQQELIKIKNAASKRIEVKITQWGPVVGKDHKGNLLAMRWVAHDKQGINFNLLNMELANDVEQAIAVAHTAGIPAQNLMVGDKQGNIAWTIAGAIPKKFGADNTGSSGWAVPQDWSTGNIGWAGYLESEHYPKVVNPSGGKLWTGNSRVVGNDMYQLIGNGGYALGARSRQIRDSLLKQELFSEQDFVNIQNDDRAIFLTPWQQYLIQQVLTEQFVGDNDLLQTQQLIENWQARAAVDSVGYLFVRQFRLNLRKALFAPISELLKAQKTDETLPISLNSIRAQLEIPMWQLLTKQPLHLLPQGHDNWRAFAQQIALDTHNQLVKQYGEISRATWGAHNTTKIQHPLSKAIPALGWLLDMPSEPVRGDTYMPRVQGTAFGASQRMVVSPGFEQQAIFHMPSSQSGHPLSPYYGKGHDDWVKGIASPLLPRQEKYKLEFLPK